MTVGSRAEQVDANVFHQRLVELHHLHINLHHIAFELHAGQIHGLDLVARLRIRQLVRELLLNQAAGLGGAQLHTLLHIEPVGLGVSLATRPDHKAGRTGLKRVEQNLGRLALAYALDMHTCHRVVANGNALHARRQVQLMLGAHNQLDLRRAAGLRCYIFRSRDRIACLRYGAKKHQRNAASHRQLQHRDCTARDREHLVFHISTARFGC